jgi:16S rRNA (guanine527-N7)-methyltransferase
VIAPASTSEAAQPDLSSAIDEVFGDRASYARAYAELLATDGITRGMIGPREADRIWPRHLFNSAALSGLIPAGARVLDLGSGAGLPGIPLAIARPDLTVVLLEPMQRRVNFLRDTLQTLGLDDIEVVAGRAESGIAPLADYVVVRAVGALDRLITLSFGLLVDDGVLLALKGQSAAAELAQLRETVAVTPELLAVPVAGEMATVIRVARQARQARRSR